MVDRKGQVILYGPPGTGKTHWAEAAARDLSSYQLFGKPFGELTATLKKGGVFTDVKSAYDPAAVQAAGYRLWRL